MKNVFLLIILICETISISYAQNVKVLANSSNPLKIESTSGTSNYISFYNTNGYKGYVGLFSGSNDMDFGTGFSNSMGRVNIVTQAIPRMTILGNGNVGIGLAPLNTTKFYVSSNQEIATNFIANSSHSNTNFGNKTEVSNSGVGGTKGVYVSSINTGDGAATGFHAYVNNATSNKNTYGLYTYVKNTGVGNTRGVYSYIDKASHSGAVAVYAHASNPNHWATYAVGNNYMSGDLRIGTTLDPYGGVYKVIVNGKILSEEVRVQNSTNWPDYVFSSDYSLLSLAEVEQYINKENHLPGIPSASIVESEGIALGDMQIKTMKKIEELTLYIIQQQKEIEALKKSIHKLTTSK